MYTLLAAFYATALASPLILSGTPSPEVAYIYATSCTVFPVSTVSLQMPMEPSTVSIVTAVRTVTTTLPPVPEVPPPVSTVPSAVPTESHPTPTESRAVPTGNPPMYPNPRDCPKVIGSDDAPGPAMWKAANANETLSCFKALYKQRPWFDGPFPFDQVLARYYGISNEGFQCSIDPLTPAGGCVLSQACADLKPYPAMVAQSDEPGRGYACSPGNVNLLHRATGWVVITSMINLNGYLTAAYALITEAAESVAYALGPEGTFTKDFSEKARDDTQLRITQSSLSMSLVMTSGLLGLVDPGLAGILGLTNTLANGVFGLALAQEPKTPASPDILGFFGAVMDTFKQSYKTFADGIFRQGVITIPGTDDSAPFNVTLLDLIDGGQFAGTHDYAAPPNKTASRSIQQGLYAQLALKIWKSSGSWPFIL